MFLRQQQSDGLEWLRSKVMDDATITIQKAARVQLARIELSRRRNKQYAIKVQSCIRRFLAVRDVQILLLQVYSATVIQAYQRGSVQRAFYKVLYEKRQAERLAAKEAEERKRRQVGN